MQRTVYHLIMRFVGSEFFIETEYKRETYLQLLGKALRTSDWKCIAYAVMSNHIHLALIAGMSPRAAWMRDANSPFGEWINRRRQRIGSVFVKKSGMWAVHPDEIANVV